MPEQLEERVAFLEAEVARLKNKIEIDLSAKPWWEKVVGTFADNPSYDEAMQLGREYRESLRSNSSESSDPNLLAQKQLKAVMLLQSWIDDEDREEQQETGQYLIDALDEDRLSERKLFPLELKGVTW